MQEPLKRGDLAEIVEGAHGKDSPNIGHQVTVGLYRGDHSKYGRIVRVHGKDLITIWGTYGDEIDCPVIWLKKIEPPPIAPQQRELVVTTDDDVSISGIDN